MKSIIVTILIWVLLLSCSTDDSLEREDFPQTWVLVKMTGQIPNCEKVGDEMEWQEFYVLNNDGSFVKNRARNGVVTEVTGVFSLFENLNQTFYELVFTTDNDIISSCSQGVETLWLVDSVTINSTWLNCDGPGLEYKLEE